jgi:hypothetical protein
MATERASIPGPERPHNTKQQSDFQENCPVCQETDMDNYQFLCFGAAIQYILHGVIVTPAQGGSLGFFSGPKASKPTVVVLFPNSLSRFPAPVGRSEPVPSVVLR